MAIQRIIVDASTGDEVLQNVLDVLEEYAVPKYFDSVSIETDDNTQNYVSCVKDEVEILKIYDTNGHWSIIIATNNSSYTESHGYNATIGALWVCENGISFAAGSANALDRFTFTIALDENDNTAFILSSFFNEPTNSNPIVVCLSNEVAYSLGYCGKSMSKAVSFGYLTTLCPVPIFQTEHYLQNVYLMPFCSDVTANVIDIDGEKYVSNGLWCVKDE